MGVASRVGSGSMFFRAAGSLLDRRPLLVEILVLRSVVLAEGVLALASHWYLMRWMLSQVDVVPELFGVDVGFHVSVLRWVVETIVVLEEVNAFCQHLSLLSEC